MLAAERANCFYDLLGPNMIDDPETALIEQYYAVESNFESSIADIIDPEYFIESGEETSFFNKLKEQFRQFTTKVKNGIRAVFSKFRKELNKNQKEVIQKSSAKITVRGYAPREKLLNLEKKANKIAKRAVSRIDEVPNANPKEIEKNTIKELKKIRKEIESLGEDTKLDAKAALEADNLLALTTESFYRSLENKFKQCCKESKKCTKANHNIDRFHSERRIAEEFMRVEQAAVKKVNQNAVAIMKEMKKVGMIVPKKTGPNTTGKTGDVKKVMKDVTLGENSGLMYSTKME